MDSSNFVVTCGQGNPEAWPHPIILIFPGPPPVRSSTFNIRHFGTHTKGRMARRQPFLSTTAPGLCWIMFPTIPSFNSTRPNPCNANRGLSCFQFGNCTSGLHSNMKEKIGWLAGPLKGPQGDMQDPKAPARSKNERNRGRVLMVHREDFLWFVFETTSPHSSPCNVKSASFLSEK